MFKRLLNLPLEGRSSIFLFGPRGTGKTSWIKTHLSESLYIDLLDYATFAKLSAYPDRLEEMIPSGYSQLIVIDECSASLSC